MSSQRRRGWTGIIGAMFILFAFLSMIWATVDPNLAIEPWVALSLQFLGGLMLSYALGFRITNKVPLSNELYAVAIGIMGGAVSVVMMYVVLLINSNMVFSYYSADALWIVMLAPIAETFAVVVFLYELFEEFFPELNWFQRAIPSDVAFAFLHFYNYSDDPSWLVIIFILIVGNTILVYIYHLSRNATAPIIAHTIINFAAAKEQVLLTVWSALPVFLAVLIILVFLYMLLGGILRND